MTGITVTDGGFPAKAFDSKNFTISFATVGTKSCITIDFGDGEQTLTYGDAKSCKNTSVISSGPVTNPLIVKRAFKTAKSYTMIVMGRDMFGSDTTEFSFTISNAACSPPELSIVNAATFFKPASAYRSNIIQFSSLMKINCMSTLNNTKQWRVFSVDAIYGTNKAEIDLSNEPSVNTAQLTLAERFLPYGLYRASITAIVTVRFASGMEANYTSEASTFIEVIIMNNNCNSINNE